MSRSNPAMKMHSRSLCLPLVTSCLTLATLIGAQSAVTVPSGFTTITIKPGNSSTPPTQLIGFGLSKPTAFQATISSVTTASGNVTQLNFAANSFAAGAFGPGSSGPTHFVEIIGGPFDGLISHIGSTVQNGVVLTDLVSTLTATGTVSARIRAFWTPAELFGTGTSNVGFTTGSPSTADLIRIHLVGAAPVEIYNDGTNWLSVAGGANANQLPIPIDAGVEVLRRGTSQFAFKILGEVKTGGTALVVPTGTSYFQNVYPLPVRLKDYGLFTSSTATGLRPGTSATNSDTVTIEDPATRAKNVFFVDSATGRFKTGFTDASLYEVPANATICIARSGSGFTWYAPQPVMALGEEPLPLMLAAAASRKTHGASGTWDVNLPLSGTLPGIEPRWGGSVTSGSFTVVFTFSGASESNPLTSGTAAVTSGTGSVSGVTFNGNEMLVNLTGVTNQQTITVAVSNVAAQNGQSLANGQVQMGMLVGDINSSAAVNVVDISISRSVSLGAVSFSNFRTDLNVSGSLNATDIAISRSQSLAKLP